MTTPYNPNSALAYDLLVQDRSKYYGTSQGYIGRGPQVTQYRFSAPRAGISQNWGARGYEGASLSGGGSFKGFGKQVMDADSKLQDAKQAKAQQQAQAQQQQAQAQQQQAQATANWQGAYQQGSRAAQMAGMRRQMVQSMTTPAPSTDLSSPIAQINQNLSRMNQQAQRAKTVTDLSSPMAQINQNIAQLRQQGQQQKQQAVANWQGAYQQSVQAAQAQQWRTEMTAALTKDVRLK